MKQTLTLTIDYCVIISLYVFYFFCYFVRVRLHPKEQIPTVLFWIYCTLKAIDAFILFLWKAQNELRKAFCRIRLFFSKKSRKQKFQKSCNEKIKLGSMSFSSFWRKLNKKLSTFKVHSFQAKSFFVPVLLGFLYFTQIIFSKKARPHIVLELNHQ